MGLLRTTKDKPSAKDKAATTTGAAAAATRQSPRTLAAQQRPTRPVAKPTTITVNHGNARSTSTSPTTASAPAPTLAPAAAWWMTDVAFVVEGKVIQAHKVVLSSRSRYFATLFLTRPQPQYTMTEFPHEIFSQFIRWCYAGSQKDVAPAAALLLRKCAIAYDVPELLQVCDASLAAASALQASAEVAPAPPTLYVQQPSSTYSELNDLMGANEFVNSVWAADEDQVTVHPTLAAATTMGVSPQAIFGMEVN